MKYLNYFVKFTFNVQPKKKKGKLYKNELFYNIKLLGVDFFIDFWHFLKIFLKVK